MGVLKLKINNFVARNALVVFLLAAVFVSISIANDKKSGPKLSLSKKEFAFGTIYGGEIKSIPITLKNVGSDTLKIFRIDVSCGCTTVNHRKRFLLPGESEEIKVDFNSTGFKGEVTKHISIQTNDSAAPSTAISFTANIRYEFELVGPQRTISLGKIAVRQQHRSKLQLKNVTPLSLSIEGVGGESTEIWFESERKLVKPGHTVEVTLVVKPSQEGFRGDRVFLKTSSKRQQRIPVRVSYTGVAQ
jgi:archaellum component FlaF (FlaF/FlaG flagellin family)